MGYQVANICYTTKQEAENAYFSKVVPVILPDGKLNQVIFDGKKWVYEGQQIHAYLPECSIEQNFKDGAYLGFLVMSIVISCWGIRLMIRLVQRYL